MFLQAHRHDLESIAGRPKHFRRHLMFGRKKEISACPFHPRTLLFRGNEPEVATGSHLRLAYNPRRWPAGQRNWLWCLRRLQEYLIKPASRSFQLQARGTPTIHAGAQQSVGGPRNIWCSSNSNECWTSVLAVF
jgi:hypothetical protein